VTMVLAGAVIAGGATGTGGDGGKTVCGVAGTGFIGVAESRASS